MIVDKLSEELSDLKINSTNNYKEEDDVSEKKKELTEDGAENILEPLTIVSDEPEPEPVFIFYNARGLSDYRFNPYNRRPVPYPGTEYLNAAWAASAAGPIVYVQKIGDSNITPDRILNVEVKWTNSNELRISRTPLPDDLDLEDGPIPDKVQLFVQLDPHVRELKSFLADVKFEHNRRQFIGPIVIYLKAELTESQEKKLMSLTSLEQRTAAYELVYKKDIHQLVQGAGPHNDTVLAILCAQKNPDNPGQNYAQIFAVLQRLSSSSDERIRNSIYNQNNNELSALEIAAIVNKAPVACFIVETIYNITENVDTALDIINSKDSQGNTLIHLLSRKGDSNIDTMRALFDIRLTDGSPLIRMLPNSKRQYPGHIAAQSRTCQPLTLKTLYENMHSSYELIDNDGMTALHYACQRSNDHNSICILLSYYKDNINYLCKDGLTPLDHVRRRVETSNSQSRSSFPIDSHQQLEMIKILRNNGAKSGRELHSYDWNQETESSSSFSPSASVCSTGSPEHTMDPFISQHHDSPSPAQSSPSDVSAPSQYEENLASQVLSEFPELSDFLEQILDGDN